ncbi:MAG: efflux RND transporter periplasmic adaptor subunit [Archangium gephyra]|uniref:Efflux RND transporter periplasmic adaptor subunit n=1 Tax=Archangium gephyra TaxID=48 RepID=A0A2W5T8H7_9BACT|nr:MAG: efflux RND transporter periplasmic adaptor subunit [Archangium gephyra]
MNRNTLLIAALALAACHKPAPEEAGTKKEAMVALAPVKVETADVEHQKMPKYLTLTGSILADRQSSVAANVAGRVTHTYIERGQPVKAGQVLAIVDSRAAGFQQAAAVAQSQAAQSQATLAKQDCERADTLFSQGAIAKAEFERLKTQCTAQLYNANAAQANADLATKAAGDTIIRAPFDGIVGERLINVGEYVQPPTQVATIFSINPVRVSLSVPEPAVSMVKEGQELMLEVSSYPDRQFPATVRFVSPALRTNTRDLIIEASAKNDDFALKPGMFATAKLSIGEEEQPTIPSGAIVADGTVKRMYLARNGQAFEVVVSTGVTKDGRIAVLEPLQAGEKVIVKPPPGLHDGSSIVQ